ncbi:MAG: O-antigen/teichoic acid export membrane protein [Polaribacter sp.]|jgi:O-antigen/teichoic acid export membrane protein
MGLKKDLIRVAVSNFIVLISSVVNGLVLPYILSIEDFAQVKTYTLYASFIGLLHFGFVDGLNIKYGGYAKETVDKKEFNGYHNFFLSFQLLLVVVVVIAGFVLNNDILLLISLAILPINLQSFFLYYYQAIAQFKEYSITTIIVPLASIIITLSLMLLGVKDYRFYVLASICGYIISVVFLEYKYGRSTKYNLSISLKSIPINAKLFKLVFFSGFYIMLGNLLFTLFFDSGRWISKIFTGDINFAIYSLGVSLIGFVMVFIGAINKTFYPHLYNNHSKEVVRNIKIILFIISSFTLVGYFFLETIVTSFLPKYIDALPVTAILMASLPGMVVIKSIYVNLYKIKKIEKKFLRDTFVYLAIALSLSLSIYFYFKSLESIAVASVISIYIWTMLPISCQPFVLKEFLKDALYFSLMFTLFWYAYNAEYNNAIRIVCCAIGILLLNIFFYKKHVLNLIKRRV